MSNFHCNNVSFTSFKNNFLNMLNKNALKKLNVLCGKQQSDLDKSRAAVRKLSRLNKQN